MASYSPQLACVLADDLPIQVERQRRPVELPLLITNPIDEGLVLACSPEAAMAGVQMGMSVYQARQRIPQALVVAPDDAAYQAAHTAMEATLRAFCPVLETLGLGAFLLDVRAVSALHDGDEALALTLVTEAQHASGLAVRAGVAAGRFIAEQAARQVGFGGALIVPIGTEAQFVAMLPVGVLPNLPSEIYRRLTLLDLHTLGDVASLSKAAVLRQFGAEMGPLYELARGRDPRPLHPDVPPLRLVRSLRFEDPTNSQDDVALALQDLAGQISEWLNNRGYHAESIKLRLKLADGTSRAQGQAVKPPNADPAHLGRLAMHLFGQLAPRQPISSMALSVYPLRPWHLTAHQGELVAAGVSEKQVQTENAIQLLINRFGDLIVKVGALLGPPIPIRINVRLGARGQPALLIYGSGARKVIQVDERWLDERQLWDKDCVMRRDYYRVTVSDGSADGSQRKIYQDLMSEY